MPKSEIIFEVKADRRGGVYRTSDRRKAEEFARLRGTGVEIPAFSLPTTAASPA